VTVFQFLPVPGVFSARSMSTADSFGRAMPLVVTARAFPPLEERFFAN